jgi:hypothetical protein
VVHQRDGVARAGAWFALMVAVVHDTASIVAPKVGRYEIEA